ITEAVAGAVTIEAVVRIEKEVARGRAECLETDSRLLVETEATVQRKHLIVFLDEVVTRREHAERVFFTDVALEPQHADVSVLVEESFRVADRSWTDGAQVKTRI